MVKCCVPGCTSVYKRKVDNKFDPSYITFHRFPKNAQRIKQWETAIKRPGWSSNYNSRICSQHFAEDAYYTTPNEVVFLKVDAMPTKLLSIPETVKQEMRSPPMFIKQDPDEHNETSRITSASPSPPECAVEIKQETNITSDAEQGSRQILNSSTDEWNASLEIEFEPDVKLEPDAASDMDQDSIRPQPVSTVHSQSRTSDPDFMPYPDDSPVTKKIKNHIRCLEDENAKQKLKIKVLTEKVKRLQHKKILSSS